MFERFTDRARRVVVLAQGVGVKALEAMQISPDAVRQQVEQVISPGEAPASAGHIPFTPQAKKVLELSLREALQLGHNYIGTEHILLGLIREGEGIAAQVLLGLGANLDRTREQVIQILAGRNPEAGGRGVAEDLSDRLTAMAARLAVIERKLKEAPAEG